MNIKQILQSKEARRAIAETVASFARNHIVHGVGRGTSGSATPLRPLSVVSGVDDRGVRHLSYRDGGQPLYDTGALARSIHATTTVTDTGFFVTIRGLSYGSKHETGFKTEGPNYIPLTQRGARRHATGSNPTADGLRRGKDFIMAWRGVTVPKRPWMLPTRGDLREFAMTIKTAIQRSST